MKEKLLAVLISLVVISSAPQLRAQVASAPQFEVASVRASPPLQLPLRGPIRVGMTLDGSHVDISLMSLRDLIILAYRIKPYQLPGTPDWMTTEVFDIQATIPQGATSASVPEMLQSLLAERFGLKIRRESKEMAVYSLTVAKGGPKFQEAPPEASQAEPASLKPPEGGFVAGFGGAPMRIGPVGGHGTGSPLYDGRGHPTVESLHVDIPGITMAQFTAGLTSVGDRPVVDRTGLSGTYALGFDAPAQTMTRAFQGPMPGKVAGAAPAEDPAGGSIFESIQSLGLRVEKDKAAIETIVIEHIEKTPTAN